MVTFRAATLLFIALGVGIVAGVLTAKAGKHPAAAVLAGGAAFGATVIWLGQVVGQ